MTKDVQPLVAWVQISKKDVARAEQALLDDEKGVVDEIGLLSLHQAISDHLFPGTSVLHTRLRYALFVPWVTQKAAEARSKTSPMALKELEVILTGQLIKGTDKLTDPVERKGVIGRRKYDHPTAQPPSFSYWTALSTWKILHRQYEGASREHVLAKLAEHGAIQRKGPKDEDGKSLSVEAAPFLGLPAPPADFLNAPLNFRLSKTEAVFLRNRLIAVTRPLDQCPSLLGRLAERRIVPVAEFAWDDPNVMTAADDLDRKFLKTAAKCSALACIARSVYFALVETASEQHHYGDSNHHRDHLEHMRKKHGKAAQGLELKLLDSSETGLKIKGNLPELLEHTQRWLSKQDSFESLRECYAMAEDKLKGSRARLGSTDLGKGRLQSWAAKDSGRLAEPLHFRWDKVKSMVTDLNISHVAKAAA